MIDVLHAIKFQRFLTGSGIDTWTLTDELIAKLVSTQMNISGRASTNYAEFAKRILEAEANWDKASGKTYCGQMAPPA